MLKYLMMAGIVAGSMSLAPSAFALNGSTFFANQPKSCHVEEVNLKVVTHIWVGCNFKWWGAKFVPGDANGGNGVSGKEVDNCRPPPRCCPEFKRLGFFNFFRRPT